MQCPNCRAQMVTQVTYENGDGLRVGGRLDLL